MLLNKSPYYIALFFLLIGCGSESESTLVAKNDVFNQAWQESVVLDISQNDDFSAGIEIVITSPASFGELSVTSTEVIYKAHEKTESTDNFSYKIKQGNRHSNEATVSVNLNNYIESFQLHNTSVIESGEGASLVITTAFPLKQNTSVAIERFINQQLDAAFAPLITTLLAGETRHLVAYTPTVGSDLRFEQQHQLKLSSERIEIESASLDYSFLTVSEPSKMFLSRKRSWYTQEAADLMVTQRGLSMSWLNYPMWSIPQKPTWEEDPYINNSWLLYYHSLNWLFAYEYAYDQSQNEAYLTTIGNTVLDYLSKNPKAAAKSYMSWNDHTVSLRTDVISYFYRKYFKERWSNAQKQDYFTAIDEHALELRTLLDNPLYERHNHGMFHALSLYNLAHAFPKYLLKTDYKSKSIERILALFSNMVETETGISLEQSSSYQLVTIKLFLAANQLIKDLSGQVNPDVEQNLVRMVDYMAHLIYPNGSGPSLGDASYNASLLAKLNSYIEGEGIESSYLDYLNSEGQLGEQLKAVFSSEKTGYAILRPEADVDWGKNTVLFSDFGNKRYSHGHHDAMSFTAYSDGYELLVDSGGPYVYTYPGREHYLSKYAHNTLVINGESVITNDAKLLDAQCKNDICYSFGQLKQGELCHNRLILIIGNEKPNFYIFDYVNSNSVNDFELIYHFPLASKIVMGQESDDIQISDTKAITVSVLASSDIVKDYFEGNVDADFKQGWVTPKYAQEFPAPVISYTTSTDFYWSLTQVQQTSSIMKPQVNFNNASKEFSLSVDGKNVTIAFSDIEEPFVAIQ